MFKKIQHGAVVLGLLLPLAVQAQHCRNTLTGDASFALCDFSFLESPTFGNICQNFTLSGIYTIKNNTPVAVKINYIRIQSNDGFPASASAVVQAPAPINNCVVGNFLASGASCSIQVNISSPTVGTFNRVLQVGIDTRQVEIAATPAITSSVIDCGGGSGPNPPLGFISTIPGTPDSLYNASIIAYSGVTNTGPTIINGDVMVGPGSPTVTGSPTVINGTIYLGGPVATQARNDAITYFTALNNQPCTVNFPAISLLTQADLDTNGPGVYCFASSAQISANLYICGQVNQSYTFKTAASTLTVDSNTIVRLGTIAECAGTWLTGIRNDNINWAVGSSATLGTNSTLVGIIDALASITLNTGAVLNGRAWALNGAVTLDSNAISPQG